MRIFYPLITLLLSTGLRAQLPVDREPHHKIVLQNSYLRLLEGRIPQNDTTPAHRHAANSVIIFLSKSTFGIRTGGGKPGITAVRPGDLKYAAYGDKPVDHIVWNQTPALFHFYVVELAKRPKSGYSCPVLHQPGLTLRGRHPQITSYAVNVPAGQTRRIPPTPCASLLVSIAGTVSANAEKLTPNQFKFFPPGSPITLRGVANCVWLEIR